MRALEFSASTEYIGIRARIGALVQNIIILYFASFHVAGDWHRGQSGRSSVHLLFVVLPCLPRVSTVQLLKPP